jgi:tol-pal system protein YbgF
MIKKWTLIGLALCVTTTMASWGVSPEVSKPVPQTNATLTDKQRLVRVEQQLAYWKRKDVSHRLDAISASLRDLRGRMDENTHGLGQQASAQKKFYQDLDIRITRLQSKLDSVTAAASTKASAPKQDDLVSYKQAFSLLQAKKNAQAIASFQAYLKRFPQGQYAASARYWLGAAYALENKPELAIDALTHVVEQHKGSQKEAGAWYKIAKIHQSQGRMDEARHAWQVVVDRFPQDPLASSAAKALASAKPVVADRAGS